MRMCTRHCCLALAGSVLILLLAQLVSGFVIPPNGPCADPACLAATQAVEAGEDGDPHAEPCCCPLGPVPGYLLPVAALAQSPTLVVLPRSAGLPALVSPRRVEPLVAGMPRPPPPSPLLRSLRSVVLTC